MNNIFMPVIPFIVFTVLILAIGINIGIMIKEGKNLKTVVIKYKIKEPGVEVITKTPKHGAKLLYANSDKSELPTSLNLSNSRVIITYGDKDYESRR